jgi:putative cell wall-binding protein
VAGPDRYGTAAAVALAGDPGTGGTVYLASGTGYADALAGGALAAGSGGRLLLTAADALPEVTAEAIVDLHPAHLVLLGGAGTVADEVGAAAAGASPGATVDRWSGSDRYATAAAAATRGYSAGASTVYLASGTNFPDAVAGGPAAGGARAPLLLTQPGCTPAATLAAVKALGATRVVVLGGLGSVSERAADLAIC